MARRVAETPELVRRGSGSVRSILLRVDVPKSVGDERVLFFGHARARAAAARGSYLYQSKRAR